MLAQGVSNQSTIYEVNGSPITKHKGFLLMRFGEYNLTVEYYRAPFLVVLDRPPKNASQIVRGAIRVDKLHWYSTKWVGADLLLFSAGHWWNPDKTIKSYPHILFLFSLLLYLFVFFPPLLGGVSGVYFCFSMNELIIYL